MSATDQPVEDEWKSRFRRTVRVTLDAAGRPYGRADFAYRVKQTVGLQALEAAGPCQMANVWELTFHTPMQKTQFLAAGDFNVRGYDANISGVDSGAFKVRLHWVPYYIDNGLFFEAFQRHGLAVVANEFELSKVKGLEHVRTGVRCFTIRTDKPADIPHIISFRYAGKEMQALVTMTGRAPRCLRCGLSGHVRKLCPTPFCFRCRQFGHLKKDKICGGRTYATATAGLNPPGEQEDEAEEPDDTAMDGTATGVEEADADLLQAAATAESATDPASTASEKTEQSLAGEITDVLIDEQIETETVETAFKAIIAEKRERERKISGSTRKSTAPADRQQAEDERRQPVDASQQSTDADDSNQKTPTATSEGPAFFAVPTSQERPRPATGSTQTDTLAADSDTASQGVRRTASVASLSSVGSDASLSSMASPSSGGLVNQSASRDSKRGRGPGRGPPKSTRGHDGASGSAQRSTEGTDVGSFARKQTRPTVVTSQRPHKPTAGKNN